MKNKNIFLIKAIGAFIAAAMLLTGCSGAEEITEADASATVDTAEESQPENSGETADGTEEAASAADVTATTAGTTTKTTAAATTSATAATTTATTKATAAAATTAATTTATAAATTTTTAAITTTTTTTAATTTTVASTTTTAAATTTTAAATAATTTAATAAATTAAATATEPPSDTFSYIDDAQVYQTLISFKSKYPEGTPWTNETRSYISTTIMPDVIYRGIGCAAFAFELSDAAFGSLPGTEHYDVSALRVGDIIRVNGDSHSVIVLEVRPEGIVIAEGNYNSSVHWERFMSFTEVQNSLTYIWTRYP